MYQEAVSTWNWLLEIQDAAGGRETSSTAYLRAEDSGVEKFTPHLAAVRESHEKERTRAEEDQELVPHWPQSWGA